eukprot:3165219-Alexandrium_andersonii.AAC.1
MAEDADALANAPAPLEADDGGAPPLLLPAPPPGRGAVDSTTAAARLEAGEALAVSYTHLTLPTIC